MSIEERNSFQLYHNFYNQFKLLGMKERGQLITAIFEYAKDQKEQTELSPLVNMAFSCMKDTLDRDREKYERICEKNSENGKKGGRPKKNSADIFSEKTERFFEKPQKADKDNDKDREKENDKDNDRDKDKDKDKEIEKKPADISDIPSEAPLSASAPQTEKEKREAEKRILIAAGVPAEYIDEREKRAEEFSKKQKKSFIDVFMEWWDKDKASFERKRESESVNGNGALHSKEKSYDTDAFFEAALKKSYDEFEKRYGAGDAQGDFFEKKSP